jgi:hypothetical protein
MKKVVVFLLLICSFAGFAQPIITRTLGTNTVGDPRLMAKLNFFSPRYADTTVANIEKGIDSCGALIYTYDVDGFWYRQCFPKKWVRFTSGATGIQSVTGTAVNISDPLNPVINLARFGAEDISSSGDRSMNMNQHSFHVGGASSVYIGAFDIGAGGVSSELNLVANNTTIDQVDNAFFLRHQFVPAKNLQGDFYVPLTVNGIPANDTGNIEIPSAGDGLLHVVAGTKLSQVNDSTIKLADSVWTNIYNRLSEKLTQGTADGLYSALGHTHTFASLTSKPTDLAGYGITDAYPLSGNPSNFLTGNQSITLSGDISGSGTTAITTTIGAAKVTNTMLAGSIDLTSKVTGLLPDGNISSASTWNAKESALTFGLGLSRSVNTVVVDTSSVSILSRQRAAATYRSLIGTTGDIGSWSASNTPSNIAAVATGYLLGSQGTSTLPAWLQAATLNTSLTTPLAILGNGTYSDRINLLSTATSGIRLYNTSDTTTNYERGILTWSANELNLSTAKGGSGSNRNIRIAAANRLFMTGGDLISLTAATSMTITSGSGNTNIQNNNTTFLVATTGGIGVGLGVTTVTASSIMDVQSTTKGVLLPRMTKTQRDAISSPAQGLTVFVTDNGGYLSWYNSGWFKVSSAAD